MNKELRVVILAAGKGTRMNSDLPKVLHKLQSKPLIDYVIDESELLNPKEIILVVGFKKESVIKHTNIGLILNMQLKWSNWYRACCFTNS